jgi:hypothetical protein
MSQPPLRDLTGRKILLIGIGFYDYEHSIATRLRERGAELTVFQDQPPELQSGLRRLFLRNPDAVLARHEQRMLDAAKVQPFDQVLVIKAVGLRLPFLKALRSQLPASEFILYQWDSLTRLDGIEERLPLFDRVLTFDRKDSQTRPEMAFRPLFFRTIPPSDAPATLDIDVAFVGWLHSDRLESARRMQADAKAKGLSTFVYLYTGWLTWLKLVLRGQARDVHPRTLSYARLQTINRRARCIYDLPHALQTGLTMRTIETLGMQKKLITTSQDVVHYDFYNADNVRVVRLPETGLDREFVRSLPTPVDPNILRRYSLDGWLDDVLLPTVG